MPADQLVVDLPPGLDAAEARLLLAIKAVEAGRITVGRAAALAGYSYRTFVEVAAGRGAALFVVDEEDFAHDLAAIEHFRAALPNRGEG